MELSLLSLFLWCECGNVDIASLDWLSFELYIHCHVLILWSKNVVVSNSKHRGSQRKEKKIGNVKLLVRTSKEELYLFLLEGGIRNLANCSKTIYVSACVFPICNWNTLLLFNIYKYEDKLELFLLCYFSVFFSSFKTLFLLHWHNRILRCLSFGHGTIGPTFKHDCTASSTYFLKSGKGILTDHPSAPYYLIYLLFLLSLRISLIIFT